VPVGDERSHVSERLVKADDEMNIVHDSMTREVAIEEMPAAIAPRSHFSHDSTNGSATTPSTSLAASSYLRRPTPNTQSVESEESRTEGRAGEAPASRQTDLATTSDTAARADSAASS
jgi:hypothetical protein